MVALGPDIAAALSRAAKLEVLARQYVLALQAGRPVLLTPLEMGLVHAQYGQYGAQPR
jgi:L-fuculose-phosphate aldolase